MGNIEEDGKLVYICSPYAGNVSGAGKADAEGEAGETSKVRNVSKAENAGEARNVGDESTDCQTAIIAQNIQNAIRYCRFAISEGVVPVASHLMYPQMLDDGDTAERALGLRFGIRLLELCSEIWVFADDDRDISKGMWAEIEAAARLGKRIRYFTKNCKERGSEVESLELNCKERGSEVESLELNCKERGAVAAQPGREARKADTLFYDGLQTGGSGREDGCITQDQDLQEGRRP